MKAGIAGAGILGRLFAFVLHQSGWDVTLIDQGGPENCSDVAAGLLTPIAELEKNDLVIYQLGQEAISQHWPQLLNQLDETIYFRRLGSIVVSHPRDQAELTRLIQIVTNKSNEPGLFQSLNRNQLLQLEPQLSKFEEGYYFPDEGQLDCQMTMSVLEKQLRDIVWHHNRMVEDVSPGKITMQDRTLSFDLVIDCRGLGAKSIFNDLRSVRGEIVWLHAPDVNISRPIRLMHPRYHLYVVPRPNDIYLIGASEIESCDQSPISVRTLLELLTAAYSIHPGFSEARVIKTATQRRPTLTDHLPRIKYADGLLAVNGLYRHGYLIAPSLVADVMRWVERGAQSVRYKELWEKYT